MLIASAASTYSSSSLSFGSGANSQRWERARSVAEVWETVTNISDQVGLVRWVPIDGLGRDDPSASALVARLGLQQVASRFTECFLVDSGGVFVRSGDKLDCLAKAVADKSKDWDDRVDWQIRSADGNPRGWLTTEGVVELIDIARVLQTAMQSAGQSNSMGAVVLAPLEANPRGQLGMPGGSGLDVDVQGNTEALQAAFQLVIESSLNAATDGKRIQAGIIGLEQRFIDSIRLLELSKSLDESLPAWLATVIDRIATAAPWPKEDILGLGSSNQYNNEQIAVQKFARTKQFAARFATEIAPFLREISGYAIWGIRPDFTDVKPAEGISNSMVWAAVAALQNDAVEWEEYSRIVGFPTDPQLVSAATQPSSDLIGRLTAIEAELIDDLTELLNRLAVRFAVEAPQDDERKVRARIEKAFAAAFTAANIARPQLRAAALAAGIAVAPLIDLARTAASEIRARRMNHKPDLTSQPISEGMVVATAPAVVSDPAGTFLVNESTEQLLSVRRVGWRWDYRPELAREPYPPHKALSGATAQSQDGFEGYFPGDHRGCRCRLVAEIELNRMEP